MLISVSLALNQTPVYTADRGYVASASHSVPAFADTHCTHPWKDGQAELTWVADCTSIL